MLKTRWKLIVMGGIFQYIHGLCTQLEHRLHQPRELLMDLGFEALPVRRVALELDAKSIWCVEFVYLWVQNGWTHGFTFEPLGISCVNWTLCQLQEIICWDWLCFDCKELDDSKTWVSEVIFYSMFVSFLLWLFSPFFLARKRFYTVVLFCRLLMVLVGKSCSFFSVYLNPVELLILFLFYFSVPSTKDSFIPLNSTAFPPLPLQGRSGNRTKESSWTLVSSTPILCPLTGSMVKIQCVE